MSTKEFTPDRIFSLAPNEIFVFGSNLQGRHLGGAAKAAAKFFGAVWGQGVGLQGQSYAIPTMHGGVDVIRPYVDGFIEFAGENLDKKFLVTPIGCGIAGYEPADIAPLFEKALDMDNVVLPKVFVQVLTGAVVKSSESRDMRKARLVEVFKDTMSMIFEEFPLAEAVEKSISQTKLYPESGAPRGNVAGKPMRISVTGNRTFQAARLMSQRNPGKRIAVLNFASAISPGGGVKRGSSAQEESLCRCSTLYPVLNRRDLRERYYSANYERHDCRYTDACIYTPGVMIIKSDVDQPERLPSNEWLSVDVVTCAAPNYRNVPPPPNDVLKGMHLNRGRKILDAALDNGADCLVLGAFGCGAFHNDPEVVSSAYAQLMQEYKGMFDEIEFAVFYIGNEIANYDAFKNVLVG